MGGEREVAGSRGSGDIRKKKRRGELQQEREQGEEGDGGGQRLSLHSCHPAPLSPLRATPLPTAAHQSPAVTKCQPTRAFALIRSVCAYVTPFCAYFPAACSPYHQPFINGSSPFLPYPSIIAVRSLLSSTLCRRPPPALHPPLPLCTRFDRQRDRLHCAVSSPSYHTYPPLPPSYVTHISFHLPHNPIFDCLAPSSPPSPTPPSSKGTHPLLPIFAPKQPQLRSLASCLLPHMPPATHKSSPTFFVACPSMRHCSTSFAYPSHSRSYPLTSWLHIILHAFPMRFSANSLSLTSSPKRQGPSIQCRRLRQVSL